MALSGAFLQRGDIAVDIQSITRNDFVGSQPVTDLIRDIRLNFERSIHIGGESPDSILPHRQYIMKKTLIRHS